MAEAYDVTDYLYTRYLSSSGLNSKGVDTTPLRRYGIAIIGIGRAGSIHVGNMVRIPRFQLRYLVDTNQARLDQVKQSYCFDDSVKVLLVRHVQTVFDDKDVVAVIISTPSGEHQQFVSAALTAGKHVFCEKPVALSIEHIKACYRLAKQHDRTLLCGFNRRYDPAFAAVVAGVEAGAVGQLQCLSTVSRDSPSPSIAYLSQSGGIFHDCIVHDVDLICFTVGEYPIKVFAAAHAFTPAIAALGDYDTVVVTLKFPSGVLAHIDISREAVYGYDQRFEVHGSAGMLQSENQHPHALVSSTSRGCTQAPLFHSFPSRYSEAYLRQMDHFMGLLDGSEVQNITEESVVSVFKVVDALKESVKTESFVTVQY